MTLTSIVVVIICLALALFIFNRLVPTAPLGYYGGLILAVVVLLWLLSRFGGLTI